MNEYDLCPACEINRKARASKVCSECYQAARRGNGDPDRECDGSGKMKDVCKTLEPHRHCRMEVVTEKLLGYFVNEFPASPKDEKEEPTYFTVGGCLEIIEEEDGVSHLLCKNCRAELAGERLHEAPTLFQSLERVGTDGYLENGRLGHSPFKERVDTFQHGDDIVDIRTQNDNTWNARESGKQRQSGAAN